MIRLDEELLKHISCIRSFVMAMRSRGSFRVQIGMDTITQGVFIVPSIVVNVVGNHVCG